MLSHPTIEKLHALHLPAMAQAFDQQRGSSQHAELSFSKPALVCSSTTSGPHGSNGGSPNGSATPSSGIRRASKTSTLPRPAA
jgi:hypothetical protein